MKSKIKLILYILIIGLFLTNCSSNADESMSLKGTVEGKQVIRVIMPYIYYDSVNQTQQRLQDFKSQMNTELLKILPLDENISFDIIDMKISSKEDYIEKRNNLLMQKDGPELICTYSTNRDNIDLVESGAVVDLTPQIENIDNIYDGLRGEAYIPLLQKYSGVIIYKDRLSKSNLEIPQLDWNKDNYVQLNQQWRIENTQELTQDIFRNIVFEELEDVNLIDSTGYVKLSNDTFLEHYKNMLEAIYSGDYILTDDYQIKDYNQIEIYERFDQILNYDSNDDNWIEYYTTDLLNSPNLFKEVYLNNIVVRPNIVSDEPSLSLGFMITTNGENKRAAVKAVNTLLTDKAQLDFYKKGYWSPVSKTIEKEIDQYNKTYFDKREINPDDMDLISLRAYAINEIANNSTKESLLSDDEKRVRDTIAFKLYQAVREMPDASDQELLEGFKRIEDELNLELSEN